MKALALDIAIDVRRRQGEGPLGTDADDELTALARSLDRLPASWWGQRWGTSPSGTGDPVSVPGTVAPLVALDPISLGPPARTGPSSPLTRARAPRPVARRLGREALAATAAVAALVAVAELGLPGRGGEHPSGTPTTAAGRLAVVDDRVQLAVAGGAPGTGTARLAAVACPRALDCIGVADRAGRASLALSADGGRTWVDRGAPGGVTSLDAVTCTGPARCWAVGGSGAEAAILTSSDGGSTWVRQSAPRGVASLDAISCPAVTTCWAAGTGGGRGVIVATTDGGGTWVRRTGPTGVASLDAISCPTVTTCWAGGTEGSGPAVVSSDDGARSWSPNLLAAVAGAAGVTGVVAVTCPTAARCWATGTGGRDSPVVFTGGGHAWSATGTPGAGPVAGTGWAPLCPAACGSQRTGGPTALERAVEGPGAAAVSGREAGGALTCPTVLECWSVRSSAQGFAAEAVELG